jgi:hypothetical protein
MKITYLPSAQQEPISAQELFDLGYGVKARMLYWKDRCETDRHRGGIWEFRKGYRAFSSISLESLDGSAWFASAVLKKSIDEMAFEVI